MASPWEFGDKFMVDFELQRKNMVESQVRPSDITDRRIMRALQALPREAFAADDTRAIAYMDQDLPVGPAGSGMRRRAILSPRVLARLLQTLEIEPGDRVLEIGTATGYGAAAMAHMAKTVVALECDAALAAHARSLLAGQSITNVDVVLGPLAAGWPAEAPYAAILVAGAVPEIPPALLDQLQDGGRLAAVQSVGGAGRVMQWRRFGSRYPSRQIGDAGARALPGFDQPRGFSF